MKQNWFPIILSIIVAIVITDNIITQYQKSKKAEKKFADFVATEPVDTVWYGWNKYQISTDSDSGKLIWYGHELVANTSYYLGPKGTVVHVTNGMNCQNCHLEAGILPYAGNFGKVYANYPQFRSRNNGMQSIYGRINDCLERSMNGKAMDSTTPQMKAIYAYIKWVGEDVAKGDKPGGTDIMKLKYMDKPADPTEGKKVYMATCQSCHGDKGQGQLNSDETGYTFPPLWGEHSYNDGAGLYRLSSFAGFVKNNMPFGVNYQDPKLTDEEAWNVAAFVNSQPRPHKDQSMDWKNISKKPIDYPFGPYLDSFSEKQHKFGTFQPIKNFKQ